MVNHQGIELNNYNYTSSVVFCPFAVATPIWATCGARWLFYAVLVDLSDAVADELSLPFEQISNEMIYRGLYHFTVAYNHGKATDPVKYLAAPENQDLGIVKRKRKPHVKLIIAPFPDQQRGRPNFFSSSPLTFCSSA